MNHFRNFKEMYDFNRGRKAREPKEYKEKRTKKKDVLQTDRPV